MPLLNETHNPALTSWVVSANDVTDFPIQNLPFAIFRKANSAEAFRGGVAIGDQVLDMAKVAAAGLFQGNAQLAAEAAAESRLNHLMGMGAEANSALRLALSEALRAGSDAQSQLESCLLNQTEIEFDLPCSIGDYTDFYSSIHHATAVGRLFRPNQPLLPNYKWMPIAYHGRSSSISVSGQDFYRPAGQSIDLQSDSPDFRPSRKLDYELEMGIFVGQGNKRGQCIGIEAAERHLFGMCLFNDWSARDIQAWEYQPLGPFLGKNFASTISPWVVTMEALAPFRAPFSRAADDPRPLDYLASRFNSEAGALDISMEVFLQSTQMRQAGTQAEKITGSNFKHSYWTVAQMLAHHTINGCDMHAGDLLGSGTQSGPEAKEAGSLLELSEGGMRQIELSNGESRTFLEDGDSVILRAYCENNTAKRIGFGEAAARILPAR
jgi:fumarylacetoacetase